jgi:DNA-binding CsgD family transcriptional regulator
MRAAPGGSGGVCADRIGLAGIVGKLLERDVELARVAAALVDGAGVLVVEGEAGIGKSAVLAAGVELACAQGSRVLSARGGVLERDFGYGVVRQLFEAPLHRAQAGERRRWLSGAARRAASALGQEAAADGGEIDDPVFATQHGLYWLVANLASEGPLALVVDDLQWADLASLRWLVYLARRLEGLPVVVLGAWRMGEDQAPVDLLDALGGERLTLSALSVAATGELLARGLGRECDLLTARACHGATGGNPLLVSELALALDRDTSLPVDLERVVELGGRAVARHVSSRLALLPLSAREVAAAAAVLDGELAPRQLAVLTELSLADVREACDRLVSARILEGRDTFGFVHPLVRAAIYDALRPARRAALHRGAADLLESEGLADRAAVQLLAAERTGDVGVVGQLEAAAERARGRGAVEEAVVLLRRALEEPPPAQERYQVLVRLADAEWLAESEESAVSHVRAALEIARDPEEQEAAGLVLVSVLVALNRLEEVVELLAAAASALREAAPERARRLEVERVLHSVYLPVLPVDIGPRTAALAAAVERGSVAEKSLRAQLAALDAAVGMRPAVEVAELALLTLQDGQLLAEFRGAGWAGFHCALATLINCERLDECDEWLGRREELARRIGARPELRGLVAHRTRIARVRGDLAAVVDEARSALQEEGAFRCGIAGPLAVAQLVFALVERGELDEAEDVLSLHGFAEGTTWAWFELIPERVALALARGDLERARAQLAGAPPERAWLPLQMAPCEVAVALASGERDQALERARAMLALAEMFGAPGRIGMARRLVGLATGGEEGTEQLGGAVQVLERSPRRLELARALVDLGAALRRHGRRVEAREPLRHGLDLAQRCGATVLSGRAAEELRATGARPRRLVLTGVESLTPSELRVARLAAEGRSNREIAQGLFVTGATVETHLGHVFQKLDLDRREALPAALAS